MAECGDPSDVVMKNERLKKPSTGKRNARKIRRPKNVAEVKPKQTSGNKAAVEQREIEDFAVLGAKLLLDPNRDDCPNQSERKKGRERQNVAPEFERAAFPPKDDQQCRRQRDDRGFGHQPECEECKRAEIRSAMSIFIVREIYEHGRRGKNARERIFDFGEPRNRLDVGGVKRENCGGQPAARHVQLSKNSPDQQREQRMAENGDEMIRQGRAVPQFVLEPENSMEQRIILRSSGGISPSRRAIQ